MSKTFTLKTKATADSVASAILQAMGIDPNRVTAFSFECDSNTCGAPALFRITMLSDEDEIDGIDWGRVLSVDEVD